MAFHRKRILLVNSYAVNNGDMALVHALYKQLEARGYAVTIATFYYHFLKHHYPQLPLIRELNDYPLFIHATFVRKIFSKIIFYFNRAYRNHDIFIASPGGYVNSYYGLKRSLLPLLLAKQQSKRTAIYSQSVGPLNEKDQVRLTKYSKSIDTILVRDDYSKNCLSSIPCYSKVIQTKDAAFLLPPRESIATPACKTVAVSVREWSHDQRDMESFLKMIELFCEAVLNRGFDIEFISTCQGVSGYRDDAQVAAVIKDRLLERYPEMTGRMTVDSSYHTYFELVELLNTRYCFTIGTRLHMCILSLINGTPAFNISYEVKGLACYQYLGLEKYSVDFNEPAAAAIEKFEHFLENFMTLRSTLLDRLLPIHEESIISLDTFLREIDS
jgi:colanic acid/amylovoran biosynthesis protein